MPVGVLILDGLAALLISQLGHHHYHIREQAQRILSKLSPIVISHIERGTHYTDAEIRHRATKLYAPHRAREFEKIAFSLRTHWPWIDLDDLYERDYWLNLAKTTWPGISGGGPDWTNWRYATKLWVRQKLWDGTSLPAVEHELARMLKVEEDWIRRYQR